MRSSTSAGTALSTVSAMSASPPCAVRLTCAPAMLTPASPRLRADGADDAGPVGVAEEDQVAARRQLDVEAVDLGELLDLPGAGERAGDRHLLAGRQHAAHGDEVAVVGALGVGA